MHSREVDAMIKSAETGVALANHKVVQGNVPNGKNILNIADTAHDLKWARRVSVFHYLDLDLVQQLDYVQLHNHL